MKIVHEDCDPSLSLDKELPYNAYLVEYQVDGISHYDVSIGYNQVEMFDYYYDKYKKDFIKFTQSEGRANPKLWGAQQKDTASKKKK